MRMARPQSEAEYLARLVPPSAAATGFGRRTLLKGALASGSALSVAGVLAACGSSSGGGGAGSGGGASGTLTFGSNQSDPVPKKAYADMVNAFSTATPKIKVTTNTVDHNTFQEQINSYLQGR